MQSHHLSFERRLKKEQGLFDLAHLTLMNVNEVNCGKSREHHFKREYGWVLLHRHKVPLLKDVRENQDLEEYGAA
jgi:hypothetical protein